MPSKKSFFLALITIMLLLCAYSIIACLLPLLRHCALHYSDNGLYRINQEQCGKRYLLGKAADYYALYRIVQ